MPRFYQNDLAIMNSAGDRRLYRYYSFPPGLSELQLIVNWWYITVLEPQEHSAQVRVVGFVP
jgi:hypothetical protein